LNYPANRQTHGGKNITLLGGGNEILVKAKVVAHSIRVYPCRATINQSINLFASDHMDPYHNKRKYKEMIK